MLSTMVFGGSTTLMDAFVGCERSSPPGFSAAQLDIQFSDESRRFATFLQGQKPLKSH